MEKDYEGKIVKRVVKHEKSVDIYFTDGTKLEVWAFGTKEAWVFVSELD